jgi:hypothetical protein
MPFSRLATLGSSFFTNMAVGGGVEGRRAGLGEAGDGVSKKGAIQDQQQISI